MKRRQASQAQAQLGDLKQTLTSLTDTPTRLPSPAGRDSFLVDSRQPEILQTLPEPIEIPASDLASVREKLASIEASLGAIAG